MCEPVSIASFGLAAASSVGSLLIQGDQADAQVRAQEKQAKNAVIGSVYEQRSLRIKQQQQEIATAEEGLKNDRRTEGAKAQARAALADTGLEGQSYETLLASYDAENGRYQTALKQQQEFNNTAIETQLEGKDIQLGMNLDQLSTPVAGPNIFGAVADIGSAGVSAYDNYQSKES